MHDPAGDNEWNSADVALDDNRPRSRALRCEFALGLRSVAAELRFFLAAKVNAELQNSRPVVFIRKQSQADKSVKNLSGGSSMRRPAARQARLPDGIEQCRVRLCLEDRERLAD